MREIKNRGPISPRIITDVMGFPCWWESEFICNFRNLSSYLKGSVLLWCYFGCKIAWELKVCSFQLDFGSNGKGCETGFVGDPGVLHFMLCLLGGACYSLFQPIVLSLLIQTYP